MERWWIVLKSIKAEDINTQNFNCFKVHTVDDSYSFFHIEIEDNKCFYENLFEYFFSEDKLIKYCEHTANIKFVPSAKHFAILYRHLKTYIDDFNLVRDISDLDNLLIGILNEEFALEEKGGKKLVRLDKMGKIGEYLFCCLLSEFFNFDCIIPKVHLQTDYNMSVYGIDTLYYSEGNNLLLFGESKVSIKLDNGLNLIKKSLSEYEKQISDEFDIVLCNRLYKDKLFKFNEIFGDIAEVSISIEQFINKANIKHIGVPIFIAHGTEMEAIDILKKLRGQNRPQFFGLETKYYIISLPIVNKSKFIATFTKMIKEKEDYYINEIDR